MTLDPERNPTGVVNIEPQNKIKIIKKRVKIEINKEKKKKIKKKEGKKKEKKGEKKLQKNSTPSIPAGSPTAVLTGPRAA